MNLAPRKKEEKKQEKPCSQSGIGEGNEKEGKIVVVVSRARPATVITEVWEVNSCLLTKERRTGKIRNRCAFFVREESNNKKKEK